MALISACPNLQTKKVMIPCIRNQQNLSIQINYSYFLTVRTSMVKPNSKYFIFASTCFLLREGSIEIQLLFFCQGLPKLFRMLAGEVRWSITRDEFESSVKQGTHSIWHPLISRKGRCIFTQTPSDYELLLFLLLFLLSSFELACVFIVKASWSRYM